MKEQLKSKAQFYIYLVISLFYITLLTATRPLVSMYASDLGASLLVVGLLVSTFSVLPIFVSIRMGKLVDYLGSKMMLIIGNVIFTAGLIIPVFVSSLAGLFISQILIGIAHNCVIISLQQGIGTSTQNRDKSIAAFSFMIAIGEMLGLFLGGYTYDLIGFIRSFMFAALLFIPVLMITLLLKSKDRADEAGKLRKEKGGSGHYIELLREEGIRKAIVASGLVIYSKDLFVAYFPLYGLSIDMTPKEIGIILSFIGFAAILVRLLQVKLVELYTRRKVLIFSLLISGITIFLIPFFENFIVLILISSLIGAGLGLGQPLSIVYIMNASPEERIGEVLGLRIAFNRLCQLVGPSALGLLGGMIGLNPIFWFSGCSLLLGSYYTGKNNTKKIKEISIDK